MKLILQIALGVFLGTLASQLTLDVWRLRLDGIAKQAAERVQVEQEKIRKEQGERIRGLLLQGGKLIGTPAIERDDPPAATSDYKRQPWRTNP